jgi:3-methylcrotonyl-CoA carboxylase alpha subunit
VLKKLLIANRGEITRRIIRTARKMGIATVAVYSDADASALHVRDADEAVHIGASPAPESYLRIDKIIAAARATGADAIHPGYGFLSENADLPEACVKAGITFVGPRAEAMRALGGKAAAKDLAIKAGVPVVPGYQGKAQDLATLTKEAKRVGYPVMIKAVAGGGGRGMRLVETPADFAELLDSAKREATSAFGNPDVLIEKVVVKPRHIEVQVFGDRHGTVVHMFERDCTLQRRNQKVIEEAPAPGMSDGLRKKMCDAAVKLAKSVNYEGAGTVEFLVEGGQLTPDAPWYFIEMNTRLQVEHPVTEEITGLDLVEWQLRVAAGEKLPLAQADIGMRGHAIEVRICAEDPAQGFMPSIGRVTILDASRLKPETRLETAIQAGDVISPFYDSMIAKLIEHAVDRPSAIKQLARELDSFPVAGVKTNIGFLVNLLRHPDVGHVHMDTGLIGRDMARLTDQRVSRDLADAAVQHAIFVSALKAGRLNESGDPQNADPWAVNDAFQLGPIADRKLALVIDGHEHLVNIAWRNGYPVASLTDIPGLTDEPRLTDENSIEPRWIGNDDDDTVYALERGRQFVISRPIYDATAIDEGIDGMTVRAPISGRVAKLFVLAGEAVEKGARIAMVEAMKMEHVLIAAHAGTVENVAVNEGEQVTQGALLVRLTSAPAAT